jgi:hypothetical protein
MATFPLYAVRRDPTGRWIRLASIDARPCAPAAAVPVAVDVMEPPHQTDVTQGWDCWGDQAVLFDRGPVPTRRQPSRLVDGHPQRGTPAQSS